MNEDYDSPPSNLESENRPYEPSWIDRFTVWIDHLPGHGWLFYLVGTLGFGVLINALFWIDGSVPIGSIDRFITIFAIFVFYWIRLYQYLTHVAARSLQDFRPLLEVENPEVEEIGYQLTKLPRWLGWLSIPLGFGFAAADILGDPEPYGNLVPNTALVYAGDIAITSFLVSAFVCLVIRSIRQLRMVAKLHARATNINLLELSPAHAFSELTSRTGIGVILVLIFAFLYDPTPFDTALDIVTDVVVAVVAIAIFVVPLMGMRRLLEKEKESVVKEVSRLLKNTTDRFNSNVKNGDHDNLESSDKAIGTLIRERELFEKVSTWPWNTKTIRGFASTLLLPIFLWFVTRLLERFF